MNDEGMKRLANANSIEKVFGWKKMGQANIF